MSWRAADLDSAFATLRRERAQARIVQASPLTIDNRARVVELVTRHRLPAMYEVDKYRLSVNLRATELLRLNIKQALLLRADRLIE